MATTAELRPCSVALLRVALGNHGAAVVVEKRLAASVRRIDAAYKADPRSTSYSIRKGDTGAYNCRKTTSGSSWSKHSYGAAVDVNWQTNPYGRNLVTDMPVWFRDLWKREGWGWGGDWSSVKDAMHFSKFPNEGGDGKLDGAGVTPAPAPEPDDEEDELNATEKKQLKEIRDALLGPAKYRKDRVWRDVIEGALLATDPEATSGYSEELHTVKVLLDKTIAALAHMTQVLQRIEAQTAPKA